MTWPWIVATVVGAVALLMLIVESFTDVNQPPKMESPVDLAKRRMSAFEVDPYYAERMEYLERTRRPAGLDFALWAQELKTKDWPEERMQ